jgi:hypothetical protein
MTTPKHKVQKHTSVNLKADSLLDLDETMAVLKRIIASAREELELIREMKDETTRYRQNALKNDSHEVSRLALNARLAKHREIEEVIREACETIQRILADIRIMRIGIQEELVAQGESGEADKLNTVFTSIKEAFQKPAEKPTVNKLETIEY